MELSNEAELSADSYSSEDDEDYHVLSDYPSAHAFAYAQRWKKLIWRNAAIEEGMEDDITEDGDKEVYFWIWFEIREYLFI